MEGVFGHWSEHNVIMREQTNNYGSFDLARSAPLGLPSAHLYEVLDGTFFQDEIS